MDTIAAFGFLSGFFTTVLIGYRRQLQTGLPVIAAGMGCCSIYGFLAGVWPLGFVLLAATASEVVRWRGEKVARRSPVFQTFSKRPEIESRINRMFGRA